MVKVLVWGAGRRTDYFLRKGLFGDKCSITAIIDSYSNDSVFNKYKIIRPDEICRYLQEIDYIVVCNQFYHEILKQITSLGIVWSKVIITDRNDEYPYNEMFERGKDLFPLIFELTNSCVQKSITINEKDNIDNDAFYRIKRFSEPDYTKDYFRYRTFDFIAEQIKCEKLSGSVAELGVFRGDFSALINYRFPDRKLFLFDTFEGFDNYEASLERQKGRTTQQFIEYHKETSVDRMLSKLPYPEKAVVCKGFFPASITSDVENENFVFVSIDVDFEDSTFEGLKFFYPRLCKGGAIFLHDYNTYFLDGIAIAVRRFEEYLGEKIIKVPIADRAGTLIILK